MGARKGFYARFREIDTAATDATTKVNSWLKTALLVVATLAIDVVPEKFKTTTTAYWRSGGVQYSLAATTAIVFSAAHVVSATMYGVVLVQVTDAGVVSTKVPLATQAYTSAPLALAALPAADAGSTALGYIAIHAGVAAWTANTDDMTDGSDLATATFVDATPTVVPASL